MYELRCYNEHSSITKRYQKSEYHKMKLEALFFQEHYNMKFEYKFEAEAAAC